MPVDQLLKTVESMSYRDRIQFMIALGRDMQANRADIQALQTRGVYERMLALYTCYTSHDAEHVMKATSDESNMIRTHAVKLLAMIGNDTQISAVLEMLPKQAKLSLVRTLIKQSPSRKAVIDQYITQSVQRDQRENALLLLSYGSTSIVDQFVEKLIQLGSHREWIQLAHYHPVLAIAALQARADSARQTDYWLVRIINSTITLFIKNRTAGIVPLVETLLRQFQPNLLASILQKVANAYPIEMARLALKSTEHLPIQFQTRVHRLHDLDLIMRLVEQNYLLLPQVWLKKLPPDVRTMLYNQFGSGWRDADGVLDVHIVAQLREADRIVEARRHLALPILQMRVRQWISYTSFLTWDEAQHVINPILRDPDPDLRSTAIYALVSTIRYQRSHTADLLKMLRARKNEQDPIRVMMFTALVDLPPGMWQAEHLDDLGQIIRDALNAADLSPRTGMLAEALVTKTLPFHLLWASDWLATFIQENGQIRNYQLRHNLTESILKRVGSALLPVLRSWETREREWQLLVLAQSLGTSITFIPELADILQRLVKQASAPQTSVGALRILSEHFREQTAQLIPHLIEEDPSWATQVTVYNFLHKQRQDLITPFLGQQAYKGRFSTGNTRFVLPIDKGFERWTPKQQAIFAQTLSGIGSDLERDTPAVIHSIHQLAGLMYIPPTRLLTLIEDTRLPVRDTALRALGRLDGNEGITALIQVMDDDRARIAIYALRHALLQMSPDQTLTLLSQISLEKVTVAKEVIRLIGELTTEAAFQKLLEVESRNLHRDARVALLRGLWLHLDREETWTILTAAAEDPDPALAIMAGRTIAPNRSPQVERKIIQLFIRVMQHPNPLVRVDVLHRLGTQSVQDADHALAEPLLERLSSSLEDEVRAASGAFSAYARQDADLAAEITRRLLPHRKALQMLLSVFVSGLWAGNDEIKASGRAILNQLSTDPLTVNLRLDIGSAIFSIAEFAALIEQLSNARELHAEAFMHALQYLTSHRDLGTSEAALIEQRWRGDFNPLLRRFGLDILIGSTKSPLGWNSGTRALLETYRSDPEPLVAGAAQFTFPPAETNDA